MKFIVTLLNC